MPSAPRPIRRHNSVLTRQTCDKMVRYCENTTPVLKIYSAECFGSFRAAARAARSKSCTHGPSRPPACIIMLELCAASLWTDALLQHASIAPPKTASSSRVLRSAACSDRSPRWALATCTRSLAQGLLRDPKLGRNVVIPAASVTASSAMHRAAGKIIC